MNGLIDIRLVLTQVLGFLLLVWFLGRYAWGPVVAMLEDRRQGIADQFGAAERARREADELKSRYDQELRGIEARARQRMQEAIAEGQRVAGEIRQQAQADAQARLARANEEIARERDRAQTLLREQIAHLSIRTAEKILRQRLDDPGQRQLVATYIDEVGRL